MTDPTVTLGTTTATDLFAVTITNGAPAIFPVGITTVIWTATDANGNASAATQLVTVNLIDTLPPVITVPANVYTSTSTSQATVDVGIASANDNIDGIVAVTNNAPATFPVGVTAVIYTASDAAGNTATATQSIYVSYVPTVGGGSGGGGTTPPPAGGGATVGMEAVYWHHNDHLGTPQALTDINGTKVWEMSQTPFGVATVNEDVDGDGLLVVNNFRFPGQYYDAETGLNYNGFRTYDPETRYTQHDPIGLKGGFNPFSYAAQNPISAIDPNGLKVVLYWHTVAAGNWHTLLHIIPENQSKYSSDPKFLNYWGTSGLLYKYVSMGAGPEQGKLVSNFNRTLDTRPHAGGIEIKTPARFACEDEFIDYLFRLDSNYKDNLEYEFFPSSSSNGYNSNSYVSGLLKAAGAVAPNPPVKTPGFDKPVPANRF